MNWDEFVTDDQGRPDTGRLALFVVMWIVLGAIPCILALALYAIRADPAHHFDPQPIGVAIGAICGGFAAALAALGVYISQDKKPTAPAPTMGGVNGQQPPT